MILLAIILILAILVVTVTLCKVDKVSSIKFSIINGLEVSFYEDQQDQQ